MHQSIIRACLLGTIAIAGVAHAAAPAPKSFQINLSAEVPPDAGFEIKEAGGWKLAEKQTIEWDAEQKKFKPLTLQVNVKSGVGKVQVKNGSGAVVNLDHETDRLAVLNVGAYANGKVIDLSPVDVATKDEAKNGKQIELQFMARVRDGETPLAGKYSGQWPLVFETVIE